MTQIYKDGLGRELPKEALDFINSCEASARAYWESSERSGMVPLYDKEKMMNTLVGNITKLFEVVPDINDKDVQLVHRVWEESYNGAEDFGKIVREESGSALNFEVISPKKDSDDWELGVAYRNGAVLGYAIPRRNKMLLMEIIQPFYPNYIRNAVKITGIEKLSIAEKHGSRWFPQIPGEIKIF